ncbi:MAG TPA: EscU/YscU/HrcU family type III secretion system export apparatus switch protein [Candidatus Sulfotelmatobacter sp.]|nr:EscU/YscU/HrcU family type III secretion system export apparatus switch protein [Candidatus Sulfotelmatobacter sp.]
MSDRQHAATPSRIARAKREGNVARSYEVSTVAAFAGATLAAAGAVPLAASAVVAAFAHAARAPLGGPPRALLVLACAAMTPALAAAVAGTGAGVLQGGGLHVTAPHLDVKRLSPAAGLKRMLGAEAAVAGARALAALALALIALVPLVREVLAAGTTLGSPAAGAALVAGAALRACGAALCVGAAFALADYALVRRRWRAGLRMSADEARRDAKENEGDPHARARRKSAHRALVRGSISRVAEASFVVANPTHVAVALRYAPPAVPVPEILVRALDEVALRVRALARQHDIPVIEDVALARLLYRAGENGRPIPPDTYVAVAQIVAALARAGLLA